MAGGDKRTMIEEGGVDRITELPIHIREHILGFLKLKDVVATGVLSSKWRYCWTGLRKLKLDKDFWGFTRYYDYVEDSNLLEHAKIIDRVLMLHIGPICEFILFITGLYDMKLDISTWLTVLSNNGVRKIKISGYEPGGHYFPIPSCLFHCRELEELSVHHSELTIPSDFMGFANLTSLSLSSVDIPPTILESLISQCLLLETLSLEYSVFGKPFALKALNLKTFYFNDFQLGNIIFKDLPKLTCVSLLATNEKEKILFSQPYSMLERLHSLSRISELTFDFYLLELVYENYPSSTPVPLENLKSLTLTSLDLCLSGDVLFTLCFLRSAPNLQNLTIDSCTDCYCCQFKIDEEQRAADKLLESEAKKHTSYNSLETIKIRVRGSRHEILLIELLQTRCPKVKSFVTETSL